MQKLILFIFLFTIYNNVSFAYLGPGIGGGAIAATLGIVIAFFMTKTRNFGWHIYRSLQDSGPSLIDSACARTPFYHHFQLVGRWIYRSKNMGHFFFDRKKKTHFYAMG